MTAVYPADELDAEVDDGDRHAGVAVPQWHCAKTKHAINAATLTELEGALERETAGPVGAVGRRTTSARAPRRSSSAATANFTDF